MCPDSSIQDIIFNNNFLYVAVNRIGIFKWLYCPSSEPVASLLKLMPITQGFHINRGLVKDFLCNSMNKTGYQVSVFIAQVG